jgi:hypothetical protein
MIRLVILLILDPLFLNLLKIFFILYALQNINKISTKHFCINL